VPLSTIDFRYTASVAYRTDLFSGTFTMRGRGPGKYSNQAIVCTSGCPVSTATAPTYSLNHIDAFKVFDLALTYQVIPTTQVFLSVDNLFNRAPPILYSTTASGFYSGMAGVADDYDPLGRVFRIGVRFKR
jgi:outer membrane receptor protein involved in Fe transport